MNDIELYFQYRCEKGLRERNLSGKKEYEERLKYEIEIVTQMGFCGYFLIVSDILTWALDRKIPIGPGRGSVAGSLIAYALKITHLDPIKYGLIFERFLNPSRVGIPDHQEILKTLNTTTDLTTEQLYFILESGEYMNVRI